MQGSPGYPVKVYCDMERVCGCDGGGGWTRVADIDMTRTVQQGSERSQLLARPCVGVKVQAASVPHSVLMELSTVECVGESMATSTILQMHSRHT